MYYKEKKKNYRSLHFLQDVGVILIWSEAQERVEDWVRLAELSSNVHR